MSNDQSIIGIARMFLESNVDLGDGGEMRGIAEALLVRDQALKEAREALNRLGVGKSPDCMWCDRDEDIATKALARLKEIVPE
jgi:hypothetical protein